MTEPTIEAGMALDLAGAGLIPDADSGINAIVDLTERALLPTPLLASDDKRVIGLVYSPHADGKPRVVDVEEIRRLYRHDPNRKAGAVTVTDVDSFLAYYAKHAQASAETWVAPTGVRCVLNAFNNGPGEDGWDHQNHVLHLKLTHSPEWLRWSAASGKLMDQDTFAEWLEGAARDILAPDFATVLEVAQSLVATSRVDFKAAYRTASGERGFRYEETTNAKAGVKGELEIPAAFTLALRVYMGQHPAEITARFRYRISAEKLQLGIVIDRIPELLEGALLDVRAQISAGIDRGIVLSA